MNERIMPRWIPISLIFLVCAFLVVDFYTHPEEYILLTPGSLNNLPFNIGAYITLEKDWLWSTPHLRFFYNDVEKAPDIWRKPQTVFVKDDIVIPLQWARQRYNIERIVPAKEMTNWQVFWKYWLDIVAILCFGLTGLKIYNSRMSKTIDAK